MDQPISAKFIFFFIHITYLVDIVLILQREILSWSLMGVKGLKSCGTDLGYSEKVIDKTSPFVPSLEQI